MEKIIKSLWFWAVVTLGVAAFVVLRLNEPPAETPSIVADGASIGEAVGVLPEKAPEPTAETDVAAVEPPAEILKTPAPAPVAAIEPNAAPVVQNPAPPSDVANEPLPTKESPEGAAQASDVDIPQTEGLAENAAPASQSEEIVPAAVAPEVASVAVEDLNIDPATAQDAQATIPSEEGKVAKSLPAPVATAPDPIERAVAPSGAALGAAPLAGAGPASAPAAEVPPLLGESSPPLSLAQVLPPGVAPAPNQIAPSFDLVRVSPDGSALIAGRAAPGANVQVFSGTVPVAEATATARGEFVVFLDTPSATPLDLQIPTPPEGAGLVVSQDDIVILPAAPDAVDASPIVVQRTPDAVHIMQPAAPAEPLNVSLDLVSYTDSGAVELSGRGQPGNVARIYTDGKLTGEAPIAAGGKWDLEVSDIAEGRYMLRVDEITPSGEVSSRTESPFQRQFPDAERPGTFSQGAKIIVQPGNTLWLMATEAYGNGGAYSQIFSANKDAIRDPDLIYPGQIFSIPRIEE